MGLGHVGHDLCQTPARPVRNVLAVDQDAPRLGRQQTEDGLEQGRLAAAIGPEQAQDLALRRA